MTIAKTYMHTGIPVPAKMEGMTYMAGLKVWLCNNADYSIEYLYCCLLYTSPSPRD